MKKVVFLLIIISGSAVFAADFSERVRIATVNGGRITNTYNNSEYNLSLEDSGLIVGSYLQWIEVNHFQVNFFGYYSPNVNYSKVLGYHANADCYFINSEIGSFVSGVDFEGININMDAGDNILGLEKFTMKNNVLFMMARTGYRIKITPSELLSFSVFPYLGVTREVVKGDIVLDPSGSPMYNPPEMKIDIDSSENFISWGVNITARVYHFTEFTAKYLARQMDKKRLDSYTVQANMYLPMNVSITYQYKRMDLSHGEDEYHLFGAGIVF